MGPRFHIFYCSILIVHVKYLYALLTILSIIGSLTQQQQQQQQQQNSSNSLPTPPRPDTRLVPHHPDPDFFSFIISSFVVYIHPTPPNYSLDFNFTIASILGSHPPEPPPPFFQFHNKFNSWFTFTRPTSGPTPITPISPTFSFLQQLQFVIYIHQTPLMTTPTFFNSQIASILGSHPPEPPTDPPPHIQKRIFIRGICLEEPSNDLKCVMSTFRSIKITKRSGNFLKQ